jgi:hypothetical protein
MISHNDVKDLPISVRLRTVLRNQYTFQDLDEMKNHLALDPEDFQLRMLREPGCGRACLNELMHLLRGFTPDTSLYGKDVTVTQDGQIVCRGKLVEIKGPHDYVVQVCFTVDSTAHFFTDEDGNIWLNDAVSVESQK